MEDLISYDCEPCPNNYEVSYECVELNPVTGRPNLCQNSPNDDGLSWRYENGVLTLNGELLEPEDFMDSSNS